MTIKAKPFIKWIGGKIQLIDSIEKCIAEKSDTLTSVAYKTTKKMPTELL